MKPHDILQKTWIKVTSVDYIGISVLHVQIKHVWGSEHIQYISSRKHLIFYPRKQYDVYKTQINYVSYILKSTWISTLPKAFYYQLYLRLFGEGVYTVRTNQSKVVSLYFSCFFVICVILRKRDYSNDHFKLKECDFFKVFVLLNMN